MGHRVTVSRGRLEQPVEADLALMHVDLTLMPTDYDKRLTKEEFADLMAFLTRQGRKVSAAAPAPRGADPDN